MKNETYYLGIDIGTSSCKTIVIDSTGNISGQYSKEYSCKSVSKDSYEIEPEEWYKAFLYALTKTCEKAGIMFQDISGVGVTGQMVTLVCVDKNGNPVRPAILWYDSRGFEYIESLSENEKAEIRKITYNPINPTFTLPKLIWLKKNETANYRHIYKVLWASDYIRMKLTGTYCTDSTNASSSLMYDMKGKNWSEKITGLFNISKSILPDVLLPSMIIGKVNKESSRITGLKSGTPVIVGTGDIGADNIAAGVAKKNRCSIRFGTCATISICTDRPFIDPDNRCPCSCHSINGLFLLQGTSASFGLSIGWFRNTFFPYLDSQDAYKIMEKEIVPVLNDNDNLIFNSFSKAAPYWNDKIKGQFTGVDVYHKRGHFIKALYEGISFDLKAALLNLLKIRGVNMSSIAYAIGGGIESNSLCSIVSNILEIDLMKTKATDAALGVAILAMMGINKIEDIDEVLKVFVKYSGKFSPDNHLKYLYRKKYLDFKKSRERSINY